MKMEAVMESPISTGHDGISAGRKQPERSDNETRGSVRQMKVLIVEDAGELGKHLPAWEELATRALEPNVFYEPWMLLPAVKAFGAGKNLCFVLLYKPHATNPKGEPTLCGFFPLERIQRFRGLPVRALSLWQHPYCFLCVPLLHRDHARESLTAFLDWTESSSANAALLEFRDVLGEGSTHYLLTDAIHAAQRTCTVSECYARGLFRPREDDNAYLQISVSSRHRQKLRRKEKGLSKEGQVEFLALRPGGDCEAWIQDFLTLEASGWKGKEGSAIACRRADREFFVEMARAAFQRGRVEWYALAVGGRPVAHQCCLLAGPGAFAFKTAFDERYADFSPGVLLQIHLIQRLHAEPHIHWMDSCGGPKSYLTDLWIDRRAMQTVHVSTNKGPGDFIVSALPLLRWLKRRFSRA